MEKYEITIFLLRISKVKSQLLIPLYGGKSMSSETSMAATNFRLQKWVTQIRECQSRPAGMNVADWCTDNGITKANYYYRLRRVRETCLETIHKEMPAQQIVPIEPGLLQAEQKSQFHKLALLLI